MRHSLFIDVAPKCSPGVAPEKYGMEIRFNKSSLSGLPNAPEGKRVTYHDTEQPGLTLRVTHAGAKTFAIQRRRKLDSKVERVTLGRYPDMTIEQARRAARESLNKLAEGKSPNSEKRQRVADAKHKRADQLTVQDVLDDYVANAGIRESTVKSYKSSLGSVLNKDMKKPISEITVNDVRAFHQRHDSLAVANRAMRVLRALFNWYHDTQEIERINPVSRALSPMRRGERNRWHQISRRKTWIESLDTWFDAVEALPGKGYRSTWQGEAAKDLFKFQVLTGLRSTNECASLEWEQVDLNRRTVTLGQTKTTTEPVVIPLNSHALDVLKSRPDEGRSVFGGIKDVRNYVRSVRKTTETNWTPYDSRRTFLTIGETISTPPLTLKRLVNHATAEHDVTAGYISRDVDAMRKWSQKIGDEIMRRAKRLSADVVELSDTAGRRM